MKLGSLLALPISWTLLLSLLVPTAAHAAENDNGKELAQEGCVDTAIGCIPTNAAEFAEWLAQKTVIIAALVAMLLLIIGGLEILTSTGDPEKLMIAKKRVTAAISGLIFILLSALILSIMGVKIIDIPGWIYEL